ncbi:hypothetical protein [Dokdonia sp.]|uniref:hypothetical protein n=1 Tax=Dokdonia sp. TaxID=2024995 RepID=UPI003263D573
MNTCKTCNSELINKELIFRAKMKKLDGKHIPDRFKYEAWCPTCEIYLLKTIQGQYESDWEISPIKKSTL